MKKEELSGRIHGGFEAIYSLCMRGRGHVKHVILGPCGNTHADQIRLLDILGSGVRPSIRGDATKWDE